MVDVLSLRESSSLYMCNNPQEKWVTRKRGDAEEFWVCSFSPRLRLRVTFFFFVQV